MSIRAVIFDVYKTILYVGPPPADADARWAQLWRERLRTAARLSRVEFGAACQQITDREHSAARAQGIAYPEVYWPAIVGEVLPEVAALPLAEREEFIFHQTQLWHTVRLADGVAETLCGLAAQKIVLGIASNAQAYTLRELAEHLATVRLTLDLFDPALRFWSFEHGFSKPDPHVFRILTTRLQARGIAPVETLMVGDRVDNDIEPARAQGWQTWQWSTERGHGNTGDGPTLLAHLCAQTPPG